ncbi:MAG: PAS domain S-box protein [Planctomycetes bacterium]|nr:PAS domain S-box protein [Planctomycetota bacterium]MBL7145943.1 PAS domain S-box protein [Phycisphaerae bacterium]
MWDKTERQAESYKIWAMAVLLTCVCFSLYYFHVILGIGTIVTHIFYVPIIVASIWWKRKGLVVALFSSGFLIVSHVFIRPDVANNDDYFRALMFIATALVIAEFSRGIAKDREALQAANRQLRAGEQQLRDNNQQLKAGEQQLRAANQQLKANEKQLINEITERKKAEETIREERDRAQKYLDVAAVIFVILDVNGRVILVNNRGCEILRYEEKDVIGKNWFDNFLPKRIRKDVKNVFKKLMVGEIEAFEYFENFVLTKDGDERIIAWHNVLLRNEQGSIIGILSSGEDITNRKEAEEQLLDYHEKLKSLTSQLLIIEERERHRLATELHDQIGQSLVMSKMKLDSLRQSISSGESADVLGEVCDCLGDVIRETRTLTFDLSSPILYELGFETAVSEWLDEQIREKHGIQTEFRDDGQPKPLNNDIKALLFRNVRELLINIIKHANARKVKVSVSKAGEQICVIVEDDGVGFEPAKIGSNTGFGIFSIRERLEQLDGHLEIESEPGRGSRFTMTAPLKVGKST